MSRPLPKNAYYYKLNRRIPNGTYGGVKGKNIQILLKKFSLFDYKLLTSTVENNLSKSFFWIENDVP